MTHELMMLVVIVGFVLGAMYGRLVSNMVWRSKILKRCISIPHPTIGDVVGVERLKDVQFEDEAVYVVTESVLMETWVRKIQLTSDPNVRIIDYGQSFTTPIVEPAEVEMTDELLDKMREFMNEGSTTEERVDTEDSVRHTAPYTDTI